MRTNNSNTLEKSRYMGTCTREARMCLFFWIFRVYRRSLANEISARNQCTSKSRHHHSSAARPHLRAPLAVCGVELGAHNPRLAVRAAVRGLERLVMLAVVLCRVRLDRRTRRVTLRSRRRACLGARETETARRRRYDEH